MHTIFEDYFERLQAMHNDIKAALDGLPPEALDWSPGEGINSISVLIVHATGAERYWIGDLVAQDFSGRERAEEFTVQGWTAEELIARLDETLAHSGSALEGLEPRHLEAICKSPRDGRMFSAMWCLAHALEHLSQHSGHIQMMRDMWRIANG